MAGTKLEIVSSQFQKNTNNEEKAVLQNNWKLFKEAILTFHMDENEKRARETFEICVFKHRQTLPLQYIALASSQCDQKTGKLKENVNNFAE